MYRNLKNDISVSELRYMEDVQKLSRREIAHRLEISPSTITRYLGVKTGDKTSERLGLPQETVDKIIKLRGQGMTFREVAEELGTTPQTVKMYVMHNKHDPGQEQVETPVEKPEIIPEQSKKMPRPLLVLDETIKVRMQGEEFQYEVVSESSQKLLTITKGGTDLMLFDKGSLELFIGELKELQNKYFL